MNNESGPALQKASFVLLVFIAAALAYLIVRERVRAQQQRAEAQAAEAAQSMASANPSKPPPMKSSFAPLRPRSDTDVIRTRVDRELTGPANAGNAAGPSRSTDVIDEARATGLAGVAVQPVPVAFTSGRSESQSDSVHGRVILRGTPPPEKAVTLDAMCGRLHPAAMTTRHFVVSEGGGLANVFVYVKSWGPHKAPQSAVPWLDNVNCEFQPYVLGVRAGQPFQIRNSDPVLHNMQALPKQNRAFNVGLPVAGMTLQKTFDKPEVFVQMKCDVHPWMFAYIGVVDHPWFAVTDTNGNFTLNGLGSRFLRFTLAAVHPKAGETVQEIELGGEKPLPPVTFTLDVPKSLARTGTH